jgi:hypothetical protein
MYSWAVDVTVPPGWDQRQDSAYAREIMDVDSSAELIEQICYWLPSFHGVLTFAFCFLSDTPYRPGGGLFDRLPIKSKVLILKGLFHRRSHDPAYLTRFDCDLRRFLDVETIGTPVLERYHLAPETVWLRELVDVHDAVLGALANFAESMSCEHKKCGHFHAPDRIDPPLKRRRTGHK